MSDLIRILMIGLGSILAIAVAVIAIVFLIVPTFKGIGWLFKQVFTFIGGELADALRSVGTVLMVLILTPLAIGSIIIGRWSATAHYGRAIQNEFKTLSKCVYRIGIGHPARLLCLSPLLDGLEKRLPEVVAAAPGRDKPRGRAGQFDGYRIVGSLPVGGSGSKLYIAEPEEVKAASFERAGQRDVHRVVIKSFSIADGSSLPQIVRESRSLDAAKKLGLVLDHELTPDRFFYVMRYVPGESLTTVTQQLHAESGSAGLDDKRLKQSLAFVTDLVRTLDGYHRGGLWHKDVKPDNIIVDGQEAHLVDFGLLSSLRSAMTLTTHGTEYFRDPEMVRMALKGVKVHEVDGARFDLFAAGAVIYSVVENSFPAHGALSQISKRCPDALRWIVRRAMTDYDKRYASASEMLTDLEFVRGAADPFAVRPAELPSMRGGAGPVMEPLNHGVPPIPQRQPMGGAGPGAGGFGAQAIPAGPPPIADPAAGGRKRPRIRVTDWWTGKYAVDPEPAIGQAPRGQGFAVNPAMTPPGAPAPMGAPGAGYAVAIGGIGQVDAGSFAPAPNRPHAGPFARTPRVRAPLPPPGERRPAKEQLARAKARAKAAQDRAHARMAGRLSARRAGGSSNPTGINPGVAFAAGVAVLVGVGAILAAGRSGRGSNLAGPEAPLADARVAAQSIGRDVKDGLNGAAEGLRDGARDVSSAVRSGLGDFVKDVGGWPDAGREAGATGLDAPARLLASVGGVPASQGGAVLFVSDVVVIGSQPYVRRYINQMEDSSEALRRMGFTVMGDAAHSATLGSDEFGRQVELISQARRAVGTTPKGTEQMVGAVMEFTAANPEVAGVVWIWPDSPNNPTQFHVAVIGPEGAEVHNTDAEYFDKAVVSAVMGAFTTRD